MKSIWAAIHPHRDGTRILVQAGATNTLLKAHLATEPRHPRALLSLLEGIALWQGAPVRAAIAVDELRSSFEQSPFLDEALGSSRTPLVTLEFVSGRARRHRDTLGGMGSFRDLRQLLLFEVAQ